MAVNELKAGAILSYVGIAVNNIVGLVYTPYILRMLGQTEYGLYSLVASIIAYLTILDLGFGNAIIRYTSKLRAENKIEEQYSLFGMFLRLYLIIGLIAFCIGIALYFNVDRLFGRTMTPDELSQTQIMMALMVLNLSITFPMSIWGAIITAYERFVFQKVINILRIVLNAVVMVILLSLGYKAITMVVVLTIFNILTLFSNLWFCKRKLKVKIIFDKIDWILLREIFAYSVWIFLAGIVDRIYWSSGQFIIGIYNVPSEIAIFGIAVQLQTFYSSFSFAISGVFFPKIVKIVTLEKDMTQVSDLFIKIGRIQFYVMSLVFTGFIIFGHKFVILWAGESYSSAYWMSLVFFLVILFSSIQTLGNNILQAKGDVKFRTIVISVTALMVFIVSFPAAKYYAGLGCAIVISAGILIGHVLILNWYYAKKIGLDIRRFWHEILKLSILPTVLCLLGLYVYSFIPRDKLAIYLFSIAIYTILYIYLSYKVCFNDYEKSIFKPIVARLKFSR